MLRKQTGVEEVEEVEEDTTNMADSDPELEVFEITDFTTASEWERFISRVEEVLNDWKLTGPSTESWTVEKGEYTSGRWEEVTEEINFADFKFCITHHFLQQDSKEHGTVEHEEDSFPPAMQDLLCTNNDFPPRAHCLVRWYGLRRFLVISPGTSCEAVISESKCNILLSSVSVALSNSGCQVPIFVQTQQKWRRIYAGECQGPGVRTDFEMVHLRKVPSQYNHLSGLLDIFKSKTGCNLSSFPMINIAIRFTYILQDWQQYTWPQQPPDFDALLGGEIGGVEFGKLPFGACEETVSELHLSTTWPHLTEGIIVDNDVYSDLDPLRAPHWTARVRIVENPQCLMGDFLTEFFKLSSRKDSTDEILGRGVMDEEGKENSDLSSALSKLTEPATTVPISKLSVSNMVHSARKRIRRHRHIDESPLNSDMLNSILLFLFPDNEEKYSDVTKTNVPQDMGAEGGTAENNSEDFCLLLKSAPNDSLTYRLALCLATVNFYHGGLRAVAHIWQEFVLELRYRWENNSLITGLKSGPPDLRCCLLHQKFQMLNCCIERKRARNEVQKLPDGSLERDGVTSRLTRESPVKSWESVSDSEEEFYECLSDQGDGDTLPTERGRDSIRIKPEGRMHPFNNATLLKKNEPIYVPLTQEPAPVTEDILEEQSEVLAKLGTSAEGAHLRARMQSASLLSDMESFKAANPGSVLEDFVHWYSPRDYVEEEVLDENGITILRGKLSARMKIPGNMWVETWETARTTPAHRQRRLFDDTKEAEKVLHFLAIQKPSDLAVHLLPCLLQASIHLVTEEEAVEDIPSVKKSLQQTISQASKILHHHTYDIKKLEECLNQLITMETIITRSRSLKTKFGLAESGSGEEDKESEDTLQVKKFVRCLLEEPEVVVVGGGQGRVGCIIHNLFVNAQTAAVLAPTDRDTEEKLSGGNDGISDFPPPTGREFLLRMCVPRPAPYSKALPQRLFCVLLRDEFRLVGAFSSDTCFF